MGDITLVTGRMTSLEISELTGKAHDKVVRDIEKMFIDLEIDTAKFGDTYLDKQWREQKMYSLDKRLSLALVSGYSAKLRIAIIDRWEQLEARKDKPKSLEETFKDTMILLDNRIQELQAQIAIDAPKVHFAETISGSTGSILIREFAKVIHEQGINLGEKKIYQYLRDNKYVSSKNEPYQQYMNQGLFEVKENVIHSIFWDKMTKTTLITGKWQIYFFQKLSMSNKIEQ